MICRYCGSELELVVGSVIYPRYKKYADHKYWRCVKCDAYVGCHKNSTSPLGIVANKELRAKRALLHKKFDPLWQRGFMTRTDAYKQLSMKLGIERQECHIGMFDIETCEKAIKICHTMYMS